MLTEVPYGRAPSLGIGPSSYEAMGNAVWLGTGGTSSGAWPSANLALFYPFTVSQPITAVKMWLINGATASGNFDIGIYNDAGTRLVSSGSTAQSGTSNIQVVDTTDLGLVPNVRYYMALAMDGTTGTTLRLATATAGKYAAMSMAQMATAFVLPTSVTFALMTTVYCPIFGLSQLATF